jgi:hypothetical protein
MNSPRTRLAFLAVGAFAVALTSAAQAQVVTRRAAASDDSPPRIYAGGSLVFAAPQGEFKDYVQGAGGANGHLGIALDPQGIVQLRMELGYLVYGSKTYRQSLGGGALGLIAVDVTTSNNIAHGGLGLQLTTPSGPIRPYATGSIGFSYFFTESRVEGSSNSQEPFATTKNFDDGAFAAQYGGGIYIPLRRGAKPISLDIGAQYHKNGDMEYLTKGSITVTSSTQPPTITPVRSSANFVTFRLGVTFGVRPDQH